MKVYPPSDNPITGGYTDTHRAYDHAGLNLPDEIRAGMDGQVVEVLNKYDKSWQINTSNDPFKPKEGTRILSTADYGNYIIVRHADGTRELHAHLKKDSMLPLGSKVTAGQVIARIGNTGNSTGPHVHSEYRDAQNKNIPVDFSKELIVSTQPPMANLPPELQHYSEKWKEIAVSKGLDVNSPQFADYLAIDKIISDKVKAASQNNNSEADRILKNFRAALEDVLEYKI